MLDPSRAKTTTLPQTIVVRRPPARKPARILTGCTECSASTTITISVGQNIDASASKSNSSQRVIVWPCRRDEEADRAHRFDRRGRLAQSDDGRAGGVSGHEDACGPQDNV